MSNKMKTHSKTLSAAQLSRGVWEKTEDWPELSTRRAAKYPSWAGSIPYSAIISLRGGEFGKLVVAVGRLV